MCGSFHEAKSYPFSGYGNILYIISRGSGEFKIYDLDVYGGEFLERVGEGNYYRKRANFQGRVIKFGHPPVAKHSITEKAIQ